MSGRMNGKALAIEVATTDDRLPSMMEVDAACRRFLEKREPAFTRFNRSWFGNRGTRAERTERRRQSTK